MGPLAVEVGACWLVRHDSLNRRRWLAQKDSSKIRSLAVKIGMAFVARPASPDPSRRVGAAAVATEEHCYLWASLVVCEVASYSKGFCSTEAVVEACL